MRIHFDRKGGFANIPLTTIIDVDQLPQADADRLREIIAAAGFFSLPSQITSSTPAPDRFHYTVTVETPERTHKVSVDESAASPSLRSLIETLSSLARLRERPNRSSFRKPS
jgi:hypothetical protein